MFSLNPSTSTPGISGRADKRENLKCRFQPASENHSVETQVNGLTGKRSQGVIQKNPEWFSTRPFLSMDYPKNPNGDSINGYVSVLGEMPIVDQEQILLEELLRVLSGFDGDYIHALPLQFDLEERKFQVDESLDDSLKGLVGQFFPLLGSYSTVQHFCESRSGFDYGMINDALAAAMGNLVHEYHISICHLESLYLKGELNLQKAWYLVQPNALTLQQLHHVTVSLVKDKAVGGHVFSILHNLTLEAMGNEKQQQLLLTLTRCAAQPFWDMLQIWIHHGLVEDPYMEFMVEEHQIVSKEALSPSAANTDDYWEKRYTLRQERIPSFLLQYTDRILRTGKYLNVIRQCGLKLKIPREKNLVYTMDGSGYEEIIERAHNYASGVLLRVLMQDYNLLNRFKSMKQFFFLSAGDFILNFLSLCRAELEKNVDDLMPSRLESLLELALQTSTVNADPYKDDLALELLPSDSMTQSCGILSSQANKERADGSHRVAHQTGLESFNFIYKVRWPVSLVVTKKAIACYQTIFRYLFSIKYVEKLLERVWMSHKSVGSSFSSNQCHRNVFALRHRMLNFIQNLLYHLTSDVLEPSWQKFIEKVRKVDNVDQVISMHMDLLNVCIKESLLTDPDILQATTKLVKLCENFAQSMLETSKKFEKNVTKTELQFTRSLNDLLRLITEKNRDSYDLNMLILLNRLNFNNYYRTSEKLIP